MSTVHTYCPKKKNLPELIRMKKLPEDFANQQNCRIEHGILKVTMS